ncbi:class I SAM-dependent methyltransferase [Pseudoroseomonas wenyumeiae]
MTDGYIGDVPYPGVFHREMMPAWLDAVLRGLGQPAPDFAARFRWCELGCGAGLNSLAVAACHPQAEVVGFDIDPAQIRAARAAAEAAGLRNASFHQASFTELAAAPEERLGRFDAIVTHGVLSWISAAQRRAAMAFIARALRPGGVAYAHYMTHPGMSAAAAAQPLLRRHAETLPGDSAQKARARCSSFPGCRRPARAISRRIRRSATACRRHCARMTMPWRMSCCRRIGSPSMSPR